MVLKVHFGNFHCQQWRLTFKHNCYSDLTQFSHCSSKGLSAREVVGIENMIT